MKTGKVYVAIKDNERVGDPLVKHFVEIPEKSHMDRKHYWMVEEDKYLFSKEKLEKFIAISIIQYIDFAKSKNWLVTSADVKQFIQQIINK